MTSQHLPGGTYQVAGIELTRVGYGAMQLAGRGVFGPPKDRGAAIDVLRTAVDLGINHIDTSDYYGPYVTNEIIREALAPYPVTCTSSPRSGPAATGRAAGCTPGRPPSCARGFMTTCATSGSTCWTW
jgi:pyridoxine 4-dehydrogenase